jgi:hypothetical protein
MTLPQHRIANYWQQVLPQHELLFAMYFFCQTRPRGGGEHVQAGGGSGAERGRDTLSEPGAHRECHVRALYRTWKGQWEALWEQKFTMRLPVQQQK